jgi:hypothetical protein
LDQLAHGQTPDFSKLDAGDPLRLIGQDQRIKELVALSLQDKQPLEQLVRWYEKGAPPPGSYIQAVEMADVKYAAQKQVLERTIKSAGDLLTRYGNDPQVPDGRKIFLAGQGTEAAEAATEPVRLRLLAATLLERPSMPKDRAHPDGDSGQPYSVAPSSRAVASSIEALLKEANQGAQQTDRQSIKAIGDYLKTTYQSNRPLKDDTNGALAALREQAQPMADKMVAGESQDAKARQAKIDDLEKAIKTNASESERIAMRAQLTKLYQEKQNIEERATLFTDPLKGQLYLWQQKLTGTDQSYTWQRYLPNDEQLQLPGITQLPTNTAASLGTFYLALSRGSDAANALDNTTKYLQTHDLDQPGKKLSVADVLTKDENLPLANMQDLTVKFMPDYMQQDYQLRKSQGVQGAEALAGALMMLAVTKGAGRLGLTDYLDKTFATAADDSLAEMAAKRALAAGGKQLPGMAAAVGTSYAINQAAGANDNLLEDTKWAFAGIAPVMVVTGAAKVLGEGPFGRSVAQAIERRRLAGVDALTQQSLLEAAEKTGNKDMTIGELRTYLQDKGLKPVLLDNLSEADLAQKAQVQVNGKTAINPIIKAQAIVQNSGVLKATFGEPFVDGDGGRPSLAGRVFNAVGASRNRYSTLDVLNWAEGVGLTTTNEAGAESRGVTVGAANNLFKAVNGYSGQFIGPNAAVLTMDGGAATLKGPWHDLAAKYEAQGTENPITKGLTIIANHVKGSDGALSRVSLMNALVSQDPALTKELAELPQQALKEIRDQAFKVDTDAAVTQNGRFSSDLIQALPPAAKGGSVRFVLPEDPAFQALSPAQAKELMVQLGSETVKGKTILLAAAAQASTDRPPDLSRATMTAQEWLGQLRTNGATEKQLAQVETALQRAYGPATDLDKVQLIKDGQFVGNANKVKIKPGDIGLLSEGGSLAPDPKYVSLLPSGMRSGDVTVEDWLARLQKDGASDAQLQPIREKLTGANLGPKDVIVRDGQFVAEARDGAKALKPEDLGLVVRTERSVGLTSGISTLSRLARNPELTPFTYDQLLEQAQKAGVDPKLIQIRNPAWGKQPKALSDLTEAERKEALAIGGRTLNASISGPRQAMIMLAKQTGQDDSILAAWWPDALGGDRTRFVAKGVTGAVHQVGSMAGWMVHETFAPVTSVPYRAVTGQSPKELVKLGTNKVLGSRFSVEATDASIKAYARDRMVAAGLGFSLPVAGVTSFALMENGANPYPDGNPREQDFMYASGISQADITKVMKAAKTGDNLFAVAADTLDQSQQARLAQAKALYDNYPRWAAHESGTAASELKTEADRLQYAARLAKLNSSAIPTDYKFYTDQLVAHQKQYPDGHFDNFGQRVWNSTFFDRQIMHLGTRLGYGEEADQYIDAGTAFMGTSMFTRSYLSVGVPGALSKSFWLGSSIELYMRANANFQTYLTSIAVKQRMDQANQSVKNDSYVRRDVTTLEAAPDPASMVPTVNPLYNAPVVKTPDYSLKPANQENIDPN